MTMILSKGAGMDIFVAKVLECAGGASAERLDDFDCVDIFDERAEDGRLIAAAGANFEDLIAWLRVDGFGHRRDDEWRRDGLAVANREGHVEVGVFAFADGDEFVPGRFAHGFDDPLILDTGGDDLLVDHFVSQVTPIAERLGCADSRATSRNDC